MWLRLLLVSMFALSAHTFGPAPIQWEGRIAKRFVIAPRGLPNLVSVPRRAVPQVLKIWNADVRLSPDEIPNFKVAPDNTIVWDSTGLCLQAHGAEDGETVAVDHCSGEPNQLWNVLPNDHGRNSQIQLRGTSKCLGVADEEGLNGAAIELQECGEKMSASWIFGAWVSTPTTGELQHSERSSSLRYAMISSLGMVGLLALSLNAWRWRQQRRAITADAKFLSVDPGGVCLTPAVMVMHPISVEADGVSHDELIGGTVPQGRFNRVVARLRHFLAFWPVFLRSSSARIGDNRGGLRPAVMTVQPTSVEAGDSNQDELSDETEQKPQGILNRLRRMKALPVAGVVVTILGSLLVPSLAMSNNMAGFAQAFSLVFASEIGDKTFFIAALLAAKFSRLLAFAGATSALVIMTILSTALGQVFHAVPPGVTNGIPLDDYAAIAAFFYFGVVTLVNAYKLPEGDSSGMQGELEEAEEAVEEATKEAEKRRNALNALVTTFNLIFLAEIGDRSMISTVALSAAQNPFSVALGAVLAHTSATAVAVLGGGILSEYLSEKVIGYIGGTLFLAFAILTVLGLG